MARKPMGTLVKPGLTFGWVVKWKNGLNFVGIPVNDVVSTLVFLIHQILVLRDDNDQRNATLVEVLRILSLMNRTKWFRQNRFSINFLTIIFWLNLWITVIRSLYNICDFIYLQTKNLSFYLKSIRKKLSKEIENVESTDRFGNLGDNVRIVSPWKTIPLSSSLNVIWMLVYNITV